jgi:proteasome lid subunit RPN8/RPN11
MDLSLAPDLVTKMFENSASHAPREVCGVVVGDEQGFFRVEVLKNYAPKPEDEFWMNPREVEVYVNLHLYVALWHSHPSHPWRLSSFDREVMRRTHLPMFVVGAQPFPAVVGYDFDQHDRIGRVLWYNESGQLLDPQGKPYALHGCST